MLNKKEISSILIITLVLAISISFIKDGEIAVRELFLPTLLAIFLVILLNVFFKKIIGNYLGISTEIKMWEIRQWGIKSHFRFKNSLNLGVILPIVLKILSLGYLNFTAALVYDVKAKIYRTAKKHGLYAFSEISETQIGAIAAAGIGANIICSIISYILGYPEFAKLNLGFAFWNLLPISNLDGNKIFFGSFALWTFLILVVLTGLLLLAFMI